VNYLITDSIGAPRPGSEIPYTEMLRDEIPDLFLIAWHSLTLKEGLKISKKISTRPEEKIILQVGVVDCVTNNMIIQDLKKLLSENKSIINKIYLCGIFYQGPRHKKYPIRLWNRTLKRILHDRFIDLSDIKESCIMSDGIHLNYSGHEIMKQKIMAVLK